MGWKIGVPPKAIIGGMKKSVVLTSDIETTIITMQNVVFQMDLTTVALSFNNGIIMTDDNELTVPKSGKYSVSGGCNASNGGVGALGTYEISALIDGNFDHNLTTAFNNSIPDTTIFDGDVDLEAGEIFSIGVKNTNGTLNWANLSFDVLLELIEAT